MVNMRCIRTACHEFDIPILEASLGLENNLFKYILIRELKGAETLQKSLGCLALLVLSFPLILKFNGGKGGYRTTNYLIFILFVRFISSLFFRCCSSQLFIQQQPSRVAWAEQIISGLYGILVSLAFCQLLQELELFSSFSSCVCTLICVHALN